MTDNQLLLSAKELGYFASRLLIAAHCQPGAVPELSRVIVAHDFLHGDAIEELSQLVVNTPHLLSQFALQTEQIDATSGIHKFKARDKRTPGFAVGPWALDRMIADAQRFGAASIVMGLEPRDHSWVDSMLVTRNALGLALVAVYGSKPRWFSLAFQGELHHGMIPESTVHSDNEDISTVPLSIRQALVDVDLLAPNEVAGHAVEADGELAKWAYCVLKRQPSLRERRNETYGHGRPMTPEAWQLLRLIVSETVIPSSVR